MKEIVNNTYFTQSESQEPEIMPKTVSISEQETSINYMRDEDFAIIYTSDSTQMTRLDKLCKTSPEYYSLITDSGRSKTYKLTDKTLISFRAKKKEMSDEQRKAAGERMKKYQASKSS